MNDAAPPHLARRAAIASSALAFGLLGLKGWGAAASGSVAMLGSLADTALDLVASLVTLWGVQIAGLRADENHRFGHGKAESLVALVQVALIAVSAVAIAWHSARSLAAGQHAVAAGTGIVVSLIAGAATGVLLVYQRRVIAATRSVAIRADHVHYQSDLALNVAVVVALLLDSVAGLRGADGVFAILIAAWLSWGAWGSARQAVDELMDREWPEPKRRALLDACATIPGARDLHDLRTRTSGAIDFAQFHMSFPPATTIAAAHAVMEAIETELRGRFPQCEVLIHPDPVGHVDEEHVLPAEIAERREM